MKKYLKVITIILLVTMVQVFVIQGNSNVYGITYICGNSPLNSGLVYDCNNYPLNSGYTYTCGNFPLNSGIVYDCGSPSVLVYDCGSPLNSGLVYDCGSPLNSGLVYDCGSPLNSGLVYDCGSPLNAGGTPEHYINQTICVKTPFTYCNICWGDYNTCPHRAGTSYGGIVCSPISVTHCNICGNASCSHISGQLYGGTLVPATPNTYHQHNASCAYHYTTHVHSGSCAYHYTTHVHSGSCAYHYTTHVHSGACAYHYVAHTHTAACAYHYTTHTHTGACTQGYTTHVHNGSCAYHYTTHVHTSACIDSSPPTTPGNLRVTASSHTTVSLTWNASSDNVGVANYNIYRNGTYINATTSTSYVDSGLTPGTTYTYKVTAKDGSGNYSADSNTANGTTSTAPTITISAPIQNGVYSAIAGKNNITLSGTIFDSAIGDIETIYYRIDGSSGQVGTQLGGTITANGTPQNYSGGVNVSSQSEGTHNLYVWVKDNVGFQSAESMVAFKVDKTAPTVSAPTLTANSASQITIQPNATDPVVNGACAGLSSTPYKYNKNGVDIGIWQIGNYIDSGLLPNTLYIYKYLAMDEVQNASGYSATTNKYTLALTPSLIVNNVTSTKLDISTTDLNPLSTQYQISTIAGSNTKYVASNGALSDTTQWITLLGQTITVTGLNSSTTYTFQARARNGENVETVDSSPVSGTTLIATPEVPTNLTVDLASSSTTSLKLTWAPVIGATSYEVSIDGDNSNPQNVTTSSFTSTGLTAGTQHAYSVRAKNGGIPSTSSWTSIVTGWTLPGVPTGLTVTPSENSEALSWGTVAAATGYEVSINNGAAIDNGTSTTYSSIGLTPNTLYTYNVRAKNQGGNGAYSSAVSKYTLASPLNSGSLGAVTKTSIAATWTLNTNPIGTQYALAAYTTSDVLVKQNAWTTSLSDSITALAPDTTYKIEVKAKNYDGVDTSWFVISPSAKTLPEAPQAPTGITAVTLGNASIKLNWGSAVGATSYDIKRDGTLVAQDVTTTTYTDLALTPETSYKYCVEAKNAGGHSEFSAEISQATFPNPPVAIAQITKAQTTTSITLNWEAVPKATAYKIDDGVHVTDIGNVTNYTINNLDSGTEYTYKIQAYNAGGQSSWTSITTATLLYAPTNITAAATNNKILLSWTAVPGAIGYEAYVGGVTLPVSAPTTSATFDNLNPEAQYTFKVRALNAVSTSLYSSDGIKFTLPNPPNIPANITSSSTKTTATITWDGVSGATNYDIMVVMPDRANNQLITGVNNTSFTDTGLATGSSHAYMVRSRNAGGKSEWSAVIPVTTAAAAPNVPANITAVTTMGSITVNWDAVVDADAYDIEKDGSEVETLTASAIEIGNLNPGEVHNYRIRSIAKEVPSDWSDVITATTKTNNLGIPSNLAGIPADTSIELTWGAIEDATGYDLEIDGQTVNNLTTTTFTAVGLQPESSHNLRVRIENNGIAGAWSGITRITTLAALPMAPTGFTSRAGMDKVTLFWTPLIDATYYDIEIDGKIIQNVVGTQYVDQGLNPSTPKSYRICARNSEGAGQWSTVLNTATLSDTPAVPVNIKAIAMNTSVKLTWDLVAAADSYDLEIDGSIVSTVDNQYIDSGLLPNTQRNYKIRARLGAKTSDWSAIQIITTLPNKPAIPDGINVIVNSTGAAITYNGAVGADTYEVMVGSQIFTGINGLTYTATGLSAGAQYNIMVRAKNAGGTSDWSSETTILTLDKAPGVPDGISINYANNSDTIAWNPLQDATNYDIEVDGIILSSGTNTQYIDTGLQPGTQHSYRIRAVNNGVPGNWSTAITKTTPLAAPSNLTADTSSGNIVINWAPVEGATSYDVDINGKVVNVTAPTYTFYDGVQNQQYTITVNAKNSITTGIKSSITSSIPALTYSSTFNVGDEFEFAVVADGVLDLMNTRFTITYDPSQLEVLDLCGLTDDIDLNTGIITDTKIKVLQFTPGKLVFMLQDNEFPGEFSGLINTILFKSNITGQVTLAYSVN